MYIQQGLKSPMYSFFFFLPACLGHLIWHNLVHILERPIFWRDQSLDLTALGFIMLYLLLEPAHIEYVLYKKSSCELFILSDVRQKGLTVFSFFSQSFLNHLTYWAFSFPTVQTYCLDQEQLEWSWRQELILLTHVQYIQQSHPSSILALQDDATNQTLK